MPRHPGVQVLPSGRRRLRLEIPADVRDMIAERTGGYRKNRTYSLGHDPREANRLAKLRYAEFQLEVAEARAELQARKEAAPKKTLTDAEIERIPSRTSGEDHSPDGGRHSEELGTTAPRRRHQG